MKEIKETLDCYDGMTKYEIWEGKVQAIRIEFDLTDAELWLLI